MFPKQEELLNYNYKNDSYAEFKRVIFHIDKYSYTKKNIFKKIMLTIIILKLFNHYYYTLRS